MATDKNTYEIYCDANGQRSGWTYSDADQDAEHLVAIKTAANDLLGVVTTAIADEHVTSALLDASAELMNFISDGLQDSSFDALYANAVTYYEHDRTPRLPGTVYASGGRLLVAPGCQCGWHDVDTSHTTSECGSCQ